MNHQSISNQQSAIQMARILVTNDDGYRSEGIRVLADALRSVGGSAGETEVTIVAPVSEASAIGHALTLRHPLRLEEIELRTFAVDGTPTDCVNIAVTQVFKGLPDLVVSGINKGYNLGDDITYSGTVSAAMEAVINHCPAFAISQEYYEHPDFTLAAEAAATVARNILEHGLSRGELINVNVPALPVGEKAEFEVTRLGRRVYQDQLIERVDPRGIPYFWIGGPPPSGLAVEGTDFYAVVNRRIAITPIHLDLTGRRLLRRLREWEWPEMAHGEAEAAPPSEPAEANEEREQLEEADEERR
jgi:5'/3'-nucleotidase